MEHCWNFVITWWCHIFVVILCLGVVRDSEQFKWPQEERSRNLSVQTNGVNDRAMDSAYLCAQSPADCYLLFTSTSTTSKSVGNPAAPEYAHLESRRQTEFANSPPSPSVIRLHNGSMIGKKAAIAAAFEYDPLHFQESSSSISHHNIGEYDSNESLLFRKKILGNDLTMDTHDNNVHQDQTRSSGELSSENESRLIAYTIRPNMPTNTTTGYPTITLAQLARQVLFPDWLWTRIAATRKTGLAVPASTTATAAASTTTATIVKPALPTVTFDNNFSRFLKLFTLVRFQNSACSGSNQNGTCYSARDCANLGGTAMSSCASGFGVCCVFQVRCGGSTSRNGTYFVSTGATFAANQVQTCNVQIFKTTPLVRQIRLDFQSFSLRQPVAGSCDLDRFVVSGQNTNNVIPILCGQNTGNHIYVETSQTSSSGIQLSVLTTGEGARSWSIKVTQYEASSFRLAPSNCLQYYTEVMGSFRSFNYISDVAPQYLNNLNYAICIRREAGFCSVTYSNAGPDGTYQPFQIVNADAAGNLIVPAGQGGVGSRDCVYDYIVINGIRLCGERLNDGTSSVMFTQDAPVTDTSNGPFIVNVRTNEIDVGGGFNLYYRQNPCMSSSG